MSKLNNFMDEAGRLKQYPAKRSLQLEAAAWLAEKFSFGREYTQQEVNDLLDRWHTFHDPALLRRELIDQGALARTDDGERYWRVKKGPGVGLETERLILRPWEDGDAQELYKYARDPNVGPSAGWPPHTSAGNSLEIIRGVLSDPETYAVVLKETGLPVGSIGAFPTRAAHEDVQAGDMEIGYWIGVPYWGRGLIPEAVRELLRRCFEDLGSAAVWCGYYDGNVKSRRVQEKCGFRPHHTERDKPCKLMGDTRTEHYTRITREDWRPRAGL